MFSVVGVMGTCFGGTLPGEKTGPAHLGDLHLEFADSPSHRCASDTLSINLDGTTPHIGYSCATVGIALHAKVIPELPTAMDSVIRALIGRHITGACAVVR